MIKIPIFKGKSLGFERDMVSFSFKYRNFPLTISKAVVDNGCPHIIISESVLKRTRIPYTRMKTNKLVQVGLIQMQLKLLGKCKLNFRTEDNNTVEIEHDVYAGIPVNRGYIAQEIPSFIGKDFFDENLISILNTKTGKFLYKE